MSDAAEPVRFDVVAPAECVTAPAFLERVRSRTARVREAGEHESAVLYRVTVVLADRLAQGTLVVDGGEPRIIEGASCAEVVEALAITVALAIDYRSERPASEPRAPAVPVAAPTQAPEAAQAMTEPAPRWRASVGVMGSLTSMGDLGALAGPGVFVELGPTMRRVLALRIRASAAMFGGSLDSTDARAEFRWWVGSLEGCPLQVHLSESVVVRPCFGGQLGSVSAAGFGLANRSSSQTAWVAARAIATLGWAVTNHLLLLAEAGVSVPITRRRFLFAPSEVVFSSPSVAPFAGIGAGFLFP